VRFVHRLSAVRQSCRTARSSPWDVCTRGVRRACVRTACGTCVLCWRPALKQDGVFMHADRETGLRHDYHGALRNLDRLAVQ
jgi:hypothetical protein